MVNDYLYRPRYASITFGSRLHLVHRAERHDLAFVEHGHARAEQANEVHVVLDDDDAVLVLQFQQQFGGQHGFFVGQSGRRLIDQQQHRAGENQHADLEPLPLAVAEILDLPIGVLRQPDAAQDGEDFLAFGGRFTAEQIIEQALPAGQSQLHVLIDRKTVEHRRRLEFSADAEPGDFGLGHRVSLAGQRT